jgi:hypothetical protein
VSLRTARVSACSTCESNLPGHCQHCGRPTTNQITQRPRKTNRCPRNGSISSVVCTGAGRLPSACAYRSRRLPATPAWLESPDAIICCVLRRLRSYLQRIACLCPGQTACYSRQRTAWSALRLQGCRKRWLFPYGGLGSIDVRALDCYCTAVAAARHLACRRRAPLWTPVPTAPHSACRRLT